MDYKPIDYESQSWKEFSELWTDNIRLRLELERLSKLSDIQKIEEMIMKMAQELAVEREKYLVRIQALGSDGAGISKFKQKVRQIDKDIARLSKLYSSMPSDDTDRENSSKDSWIFYLLALGANFDNNIDKDSPLDLRGSIMRAFKSRDLETFLSVTEKFFQLKRMKKNITNRHETAINMWKSYIEQTAKEEEAERLKL